MKKKKAPAIDLLRERRELQRVLGNMPRSKLQTNALFEADAEILRLGARDWLVTSTDSLGEEMTEKLYVDPKTWGWMTVMSSVSDLSATGAEGLGLLISAQWASKTIESTKKAFYQGAREALRIARLPLLGGDSGSALDHVFTGTVLGRCATKPLTRVGARPGDAVVLLGPPRTGAGPALALRYLGGFAPTAFPEKYFRPAPDPWRATAWRDHASASIDTSDGFAMSLAILGTLNGVGFEVDWDDSFFLPAALRFCHRHKLPPALLWTSDHGDFETLLCISEKSLLKIPDRLYRRVGRVTARREKALLNVKGKRFEIPLKEIADGGRDLPSIRRLTKSLASYFRSAF